MYTATVFGHATVCLFAILFGMVQLRSYRHWVLVGVLALGAFFVWSAVLAREPSEVLKVAFLDVGQGDAIYIEAPNGHQVLIDGGGGRAVLEELARVMPFMDRSIDTVIATHPDLDHIGGLPDVFHRYDVGMFVESGVEDAGADNTALHQAVLNEGLVPVVLTERATLDLGSGVTLTILFPDRPVGTVDPNVGSIVARLVYGDTSFMLTGDSPQAIEEYLVERIPEGLASTVLKLGHHGSKTATAAEFLDAVHPAYTIVSAGCDNKYGHPHAEVLERVHARSIPVLQTCESGTIVFLSDGRALTLD